jgi:3-methyladenine DNA glycosylase AlkD
MLLRDKHDLMHKACGWMLREVGKKNIQTLKRFLDANANKMPRVMLRYAIEKLPKKQQKYYLKLKK